MVAVRCANPACRRVVAEMYGTDTAVWTAWWSARPEQTGVALRYGLAVRWRCPGWPRCKGDYPLRGEKLAAAFTLAAAQSAKAIMLPLAPRDAP